MEAEPQERGDRLTWIIGVGAPTVAWVAHNLLGSSMLPGDIPSWIWMFGAGPLLEELAFRPLLQRGIQERIPVWLDWTGVIKPLAGSADHLANLTGGMVFVAPAHRNLATSILLLVIDQTLKLLLPIVVAPDLIRRPYKS